MIAWLLTDWHWLIAIYLVLISTVTAAAFISDRRSEEEI